MDQDKVVGFIYGTKRKFPYLERGLEPDRGWINVMFVDKAYWKQGIGQQLLDLCEGELKRRGCRNITLGAYSPSYFFWGVDPVHYPEAVRFFEQNGYIRDGMYVHKADKYCDEGNTDKLEKMHNWGFLTWAISRGLPVFLACYFGSGIVDQIFAVCPAWYRWRTAPLSRLWRRQPAF